MPMPTAQTQRDDNPSEETLLTQDACGNLLGHLLCRDGPEVSLAASSVGVRLAKERMLAHACLRA